jgi:hypothetical protein
MLPWVILIDKSILSVEGLIAYSETNENARSTTKSVPFGRSLNAITPFPKHSLEG